MIHSYGADLAWLSSPRIPSLEVRPFAPAAPKAARLLAALGDRQVAWRPPVARVVRTSDRRSTSDKTGQHTRARWRKVLLRKYGPLCHICLAAGVTDHRAIILVDAPWPAPLSFTRDHLKPRSLGGRDSVANQRPAHHLCNTRRGNRAMSPEGAREWTHVTYQT